MAVSGVVLTALSVGDRVKFAEEVQRYTVRAVTHTEDNDPPDVTNACEDSEGVWCHGGAEVSGRTANHITLRIDSVIPARAALTATTPATTQAPAQDGERGEAG